METQLHSKIHGENKKTTSRLPSSISILPPLVAERIAAGEVIERPASVVKELVENSIDAGATQIEVRLRKGGCDLIEVLDNGRGMNQEDLEICICRHATSKIHELDDLSNLATLGFRGEALPSIAAVSELTITSRVQNTFELKVAQSASIRGKSEQVANYHFLGSNHGTRIRVASLFSQIPARLKFLKSPGAESSAVREILERLALTHPEIRFAYFNDDKQILDLPAEALKTRAERLLSDDNPCEVLEAKLDGEWGIEIIWLKGLSNPHTRSIYQIVNGRALRDRIIQQAILNPLRQSFLPGNFPSIVVKINIPSDEIDVNVHPTKTEIRFLDSRKIFALCSAAIEKLTAGSHFYSASTQASANYSSNQSIYNNAQSWQFQNPHHQPSLSAFIPTENSGSPTKTEELFDTTPFGQYRGTLFSTYFVFEKGEELLFVDQHAAHERIRYEKLKRAVLRPRAAPDGPNFTDAPNVIEQQELLVPEVVRLPQHKIQELRPKIAVFSGLGFDADFFGEEAILFRAIPAIWGMNQLQSRLKNLIERVLETNNSSATSDSIVWDEVLFEKIAMEACRSSYKAGDFISETTAIDVTRKLFACEHPGNCPHGRPTTFKIHQSKVEEWFQRKL